MTPFPDVTDLTGLPVWGDDVDGDLRCVQVQDLTPDVRTFVFESVTPAVFRHLPGQFLTLHAEVGGVELDRCYTISSPPTRPHRLAITVKRHPGGPMSNWLHDNLVPGRRLRADGPYGSFTPSGRANKYLFLSGGSGVTPSMSMTRTLYDLGGEADVLFIHSARTPADIIFRRELDLMTATAPSVRVVHVCERDTPSERWAGLRGFLSADMLRVLAPDLAEREVYSCGPAPYMANARQVLEELGCDMSRYHEESYTFSQLPTEDRAAVGEDSVYPGPGTNDAAQVATNDAAVVAARSFIVEFSRSGTSFACSADGFILDAAYDAGLSPASSCGRGMCGTCKSTLSDGTVDMQHNGGIRPREIAAGKILICCSRPTSDLVIDA